MASKKPIVDNNGKLKELQVSDDLLIQKGLVLPEVAAPGTPSANTVIIYAKADGNVYQKNDTGAETNLAAAGGGGGSLTVIDGTATFNFPNATSVEEENVVVTIADANLTYANVKSISFIPITNTDHESLDDFQWDNLVFNLENIIDNVSFDLRATAHNGSWGAYDIIYRITY